MSITDQLVHPGHRLTESLGDVGQRNHLHIGSEHIRGSWDRTHIRHDATSGTQMPCTGRVTFSPTIKDVTHGDLQAPPSDRRAAHDL